MGAKGGAPRGNGNALKHGGWSVLRAPAHGRLDGRTGLAKVVRQVRDALVRDLGAERLEDLSQQQRLLVARVVAKSLFAEATEAWLVDHGVIGEDGTVAAALGKHYLAVANSLRLDLQALGLRRVPRPVPSLEEYLARRYGVDGDPADAADPGDQPEAGLVGTGDGQPAGPKETAP